MMATVRYPRRRDFEASGDAVNFYRNAVADWWIFKALPAALGLLLLAWLGGCARLGLPADLSLEGGLHELLRRGVHLSWSVPMERVLPVLPAMPRRKIGPPAFAPGRFGAGDPP